MFNEEELKTVNIYNMLDKCDTKYETASEEE